jgi:hypothetical protein
MSGSMSGDWKRSYGVASGAPRTESRGHRDATPTATAPVVDSTVSDRRAAVANRHYADVAHPLPRRDVALVKRLLVNTRAICTAAIPLQEDHRSSPSQAA